MNELKIENIIIGKQFENCDNYEKFVKIVSEKNIKVKIVEAGARINIEKDLYIDVLWPFSKNKILENVLNNNSVVLKLVYLNFSCIFTGDIEEIAEKSILEKYKNFAQILKADIVKIAHHGSKTSSTEEFLKKVNPKIALIGVGKNNKFGHPNKNVIERIKNNKIKIFRTDENGEISISTNGKGKIKIVKTIE